MSDIIKFALLIVWLMSTIGIGWTSETNTTIDGHVKMVAEVSTNQVQVAEPLTLRLTVTAPADVTVSFPSVSERVGQWDVISHQDVLGIPAGDQRTWTRTLIFETIETGDISIPPMDASWSESDSAPTLIASKPFQVHVASVLEDRADPTKFRDIASVIDVPLPPPEQSYGWIGWTAAGCLAAIALAGLVVVVARRRQPTVTPRRWALDEIDAIVNSDSFQQHDCETVLQRLSDCLRDYLTFQFGVAASFQTREELLAAVAEKQVESLDTTGLARLLATADAVKFASAVMTAEELLSAVELARQIIVSEGVC